MAHRSFWPPSAISIRGCGMSLPNGAYSGIKLDTALDKIGQWTIEIVKRSDAVCGFVVLPRRWVVERTLAWLNRNRRLAKDFETSLQSALTWLFIASVKLLMRRRSNAATTGCNLSLTLSTGEHPGNGGRAGKAVDLDQGELSVDPVHC